MTMIAVLRERLTIKSSGTSMELASRFVPDGEIWSVDYLAIRCSTPANADVDIALRNGGYDHIVYQETDLGANIWSVADVLFNVLPRERIVGLFTQVNTSSILEIHVTGEIHFER